MKYLNYDETLNLVEDFMQKSGVGKFCREYCKGACCGGCYTSKRACHLPKNEGGRRIACTAFICGDLFALANVSWGGNLRSQWLAAKEKINSAVRPYVLSSRRGDTLCNPYYDPPLFKPLKENFKIVETDVTSFFNDENAAKIYEKISQLKGKFRIYGKTIDVFA